MTTPSKVNSYIIGQAVRLDVEFKRTNGTFIDPSVIRLLHKDPSSNVAVLVYGTDTGMVKSSTGKYYYDLTLDESGQWYYRWEGTGTAIAAEQWRFTVDSATVST